MREYPAILAKCALFAGLGADLLPKLLACLGTRRLTFSKGRFALREGDAVVSVGVVLSGSVHIVQDDFFGNRNLMARVGPGGLFGEALACSSNAKSPVGILVAEQSEIMFMDCRKIIKTCPAACGHHAALVRNLLALVADRNLELALKLRHLTRRTTREKLLSYLGEQARRAGKAVFDIPFNRQELSEYLSVERSAMSAELSRMRRDGLRDYARNSFQLRSPRGGGK
jgi:CRP-like cAMP-binding protein